MNKIPVPYENMEYDIYNVNYCMLEEIRVDVDSVVRHSKKSIYLVPVDMLERKYKKAIINNLTKHTFLDARTMFKQFLSLCSIMVTNSFTPNLMNYGIRYIYNIVKAPDITSGDFIRTLVNDLQSREYDNVDDLEVVGYYTDAMELFYNDVVETIAFLYIKYLNAINYPTHGLEDWLVDRSKLELPNKDMEEKYDDIIELVKYTVNYFISIDAKNIYGITLNNQLDPVTDDPIISYLLDKVNHYYLNIKTYDEEPNPQVMLPWSLIVVDANIGQYNSSHYLVDNPLGFTSELQMVMVNTNILETMFGLKENMAPSMINILTHYLEYWRMSYNA